MGWFQNLFIENESKQEQIKSVAEESAAKAGFDITVKPDGRIRYNTEEAYHDQESVWQAINQAFER